MRWPHRLNSAIGIVVTRAGDQCGDPVPGIEKFGRLVKIGTCPGLQEHIAHGSPGEVRQHDDLDCRVLDDDAPTDALSRGQALVLTGAAALERGDAVTARRRLESGIAVAAGPVDLPSILLAAADLAHLHHADGDLDDAALLLGWVEGCRAVLGLPIPPTQRARLDEVAGAVDSGTAAAARHRGSSLTLAELLSMLGLGDV